MDAIISGGNIPGGNTQPKTLTGANYASQPQLITEQTSKTHDGGDISVGATSRSDIDPLITIGHRKTDDFILRDQILSGGGTRNDHIHVQSKAIREGLEKAAEDIANGLCTKLKPLFDNQLKQDPNMIDKLKAYIKDVLNKSAIITKANLGLINSKDKCELQVTCRRLADAAVDKTLDAKNKRQNKKQGTYNFILSLKSLLKIACAEKVAQLLSA